ncbi:alpha/beta hydrolase family protein [Roseateles sp. NT4]|uniref:alpha/beta hydrolase family protein n=1 Tax=Roseateles sp. NT4 TaxID=3453715 RepID=UPI003EEE501E
MKRLFEAVPVASYAKLADSRRKYPLVVLSHGTKSLSLSLAWFAYALASRGYIVAAVDHHGDTVTEPSLAPQGFLFSWERARDLSAVVDQLLVDPEMGAHIDQSRMGAAGHSAGGHTVIMLAGAIFDSEKLKVACRSPVTDPVCDYQDQNSAQIDELRRTDPVARESLARAGTSAKDQRIKAVFAMAPALGVAYSKADVDEVEVPVRIVVGAGDEITPSKTNAAHYASIIRRSALETLPGNVGHFVFGSLCSAEGQNMPEMIVCHDAPDVDRAAVHAHVAELALKFFSSNLAPKSLPRSAPFR